MNCCDDYGQCQGGPGCPAGKPIRTIKPYPAVVPDDDEPHVPGGLLADMLVGFIQAAALVVAVILTTAVVVGVMA